MNRHEFMALLGALILLIMPARLFSQTQDEERAVLDTVDDFFAAMTARDGNRLRALTIQGSLNIWQPIRQKRKS